jgi:hypothetical protein
VHPPVALPRGQADRAAGGPAWPVSAVRPRWDSIFTEADDLEVLRNAVRDAVRCHFDEVIRLHFVREEVFAA